MIEVVMVHNPESGVPEAQEIHIPVEDRNTALNAISVAKDALYNPNERWLVLGGYLPSPDTLAAQLDRAENPTPDPTKEEVHARAQHTSSLLGAICCMHLSHSQDRDAVITMDAQPVLEGLMYGFKLRAQKKASRAKLLDGLAYNKSLTDDLSRVRYTYLSTEEYAQRSA